METNSDLITVNVNVDIPTEALKRIVANVKMVVGADAKGHYHADTAEAVGKMIGKFINGHDFTAFTADPTHYQQLL